MTFIAIKNSTKKLIFQQKIHLRAPLKPTESAFAASSFGMEEHRMNSTDGKRNFPENFITQNSSTNEFFITDYMQF